MTGVIRHLVPMFALAGLSGGAPATSKFALPMRFEQNLGQAGLEVRYIGRARGFSLELGEKQVRFSRPGAETLTLSFRGAARARMALERVLPAKVSYLVANRRITDIPVGERVRYEGIYPGIDLVFHHDGGEWEYDFELAPGADPSRIRLAAGGVRGLDVDRNGDLIARFRSSGEMRWRRPIAYQIVGGERREIASAFVLEGRSIRFRVGRWDRSQALVIDPSFVFSSLIAGSGEQVARGVGIDGSGNIYICGGTNSGNLPTSAASYQASYHGATFWDLGDAFVAKFSSTGALTYLTYLGGSGDDACSALAVDPAGNAYITGVTSSTDFPIAGNVSQTTYGGSGGNFIGSGGDAFVAKLTPSGGLAYSTYLGGSMDDAGGGIAIDSSGNAYVVGATLSSNFPVTGGFQTRYGGSANGFVNQNGYVTWNAGDAFVEKLNSSGQRVAGTYLGGSLDEGAVTVALDSSGNVWTAGSTCSNNFPLMNPFQNVIRGQSPGPLQPVANMCEGFLAELNSSLSQLLYSTFLGGNGDDLISAIVPDSSGNIYLTGLTASTNFPVTAGAYKTSYSGPTASTGLLVLLGDAFVAKLNPAANKLVYSTYLGGSRDDAAGALAVDSGGNAYIAGLTKSPDLPVSSNAMQTRFGGSGGSDQFGDGFIAKLDPTGSQLLYASYLGGSAGDAAVGMAVANGVMYVVGGTGSPNFPVTAGAPAFSGETDVFLSAITGLVSVPSVGVSNVASYDASAISPGEVVAIFVHGMGPQTLTTAVLDPTTGRVATTLAGTSVLFNGIAAPMVYTSATQLAAIVPYELAGQSTAQIIVQYNGVQSPPLTMPVAPAVPGLFSANESGTGVGAFQNQDGSFNSQSNPAAAGSIVVLYGTGQGQTNPAGVDGELATTVLPIPVANVSVTFDGIPSAHIAYEGPIPEIAEGFWQINAQVPSGLSAGAHAVQVTAGGRASQSNLLIYTGP